MLRPCAPPLARFAAAGLLALLALAPGAFASPLQFLPVGDPLEDELRILDLYAPTARGGRILLPHLHARPLQLAELQGDGSAPASAERGRGIALARLERALQRDVLATFASEATARSTPRLFVREAPNGDRLELSGGLEGGGAIENGDSRWTSGSGLHVRAGAQVDRWLAYSHVLVGQFEGARTFADPIVANTDVIVHTEETTLGYTGASGHWRATLGRQRWHWGPGQEGSLILSKTAAPLTALEFRLRLEPLHADGIVLNATLDAAAGEQLAAHRLEWQPRDGVRLGLTETARYRSDTWQPIYLAGVLPYFLVQRLEVQDSPDSLDALRNNVMVGLDAAVRIADGTRVYGEWLVDDLHAKSGAFPNKYGVQLGLEGVGDVRGSRVAWGAEYTRLSRFVYTSFFGRAYVAQDRPLGFPTGPDSRRVRVRLAWDPAVAWQVSASAARTDRGESGLDVAFVPGEPVPPVSRFAGVVETAREAGAAVRWMPASGVELAVSGGWRRTENAGHVGGVTRDLTQLAAAIRLTR